MKNKKKTLNVIQIINALIWAAVILVNSFAIKTGSDNQLVFYALIIGAGLQICLFNYMANRLEGKENGKTQIV